jgi:hypothetical protein
MSESGVFSELVGVCDEFLNVVLDFPISARQFSDAQETQTAGRFVDLLQWLHYEEWLREQVKLYEAKRIVMKGHSNENDDDDDNGGEVDVQDTAEWGRREKKLFNDIVQLQEDTFARSSQFLANKDIVKRYTRMRVCWFFCQLNVFFFFFFFFFFKVFLKPI